MSSIKEGYAFFTLYLSQILWTLYLIWAFVFDDILNLLYFPFPSKYWAAIIPTAILFSILCFFLFIAIFSLIKTEPINSINLIKDEHSVFEDKLTENSMNYMNDIKIEQINKLLYETSLYFE
ncbi:phosphatidylinositol N-acetylglucosaminyltransferase subunit P, putative [Plasmodium gallinaceum]|uniref:Phosphatidylinositol N-acetylglucosaminyltransferase subunit P, putative n=1 Tax=Plasmodium gallinaceum TaxID=5849 RepID=A0A1J1GXD0_PLAGA|nr:phosphatidylinositol N-acetylglucosaminyltransferase subunit P, putative [Plasmodium gallinaceum]CRG96904.1 phosphatidylinositol N-acetylglucosaminyltransferase subunit P, putative [Plasmodium gallinaceum]